MYEVFNRKREASLYFTFADLAGGFDFSGAEFVSSFKGKYDKTYCGMKKHKLRHGVCRYEDATGSIVEASF